MLSPGTEDLIARLERALELADREPFRQAAEAALAPMPLEGIDTERVAGFGPPAMMANDNDLIRSPPIPA